MMTPEQRSIARTVIRVMLLGSALIGVLWTIHALQQPGLMAATLAPVVGSGAAPGLPSEAAKPPLTNSGGNK